jgi:hypothetical protein
MKEKAKCCSEVLIASLFQHGVISRRPPPRRVLTLSPAISLAAAEMYFWAEPMKLTAYFTLTLASNRI